MSFNKENSYGNILKRLSAFGGVQVFNILIALVRGKFVALFLGPEGMGVSALLTSSTNTVQQFSSLGLNLAIVKEAAAGKDDANRFQHVLAVATHLILLTSLLGAAVCAFASPLLSVLTFGNYEHTFSFILLAMAVALSTGGAGYLALLQGTGQVKRLAKASLVGGLTGLLCGVPLYWLFGINGIVPAMIILALAMFLFYRLSFARYEQTEKVKFVWNLHKPLVKKLVSLGLILMVGTLVGTAVGYVINIFIRIVGSASDVGLYQAANSLTNQYTGVVFSALALDYFPRLSAIAHDKKQLREVVRRQSEIVILIMAPLVAALIVTAPWIIRLLLTQEFMGILPLMRWMGLGILIQGIAFPLGYIYIAAEDRKTYFWMEVVWSNVLWLVCSVLFYYLYSLEGLGISLVVRGAIDLLINYIVIRKRYGFRYDKDVLLFMAGSIIINTLLFFLTFAEIRGTYGILGATIGCSIYYLRRRLKRPEKGDSEKDEKMADSEKEETRVDQADKG